MTTEQQQWDESMKHYNRNLLLLMPLAVLITLLLSPIGALAQTSSVSCVSNTTLSITVNDTRCIDDVCKEFSRSTSEICAYGCDGTLNICNPSPLNSTLAVIGIFIGFIIVVALIWRFVQ